MKIREIEGGIPTCVAIIVTVCATILLAQQSPEKPATTPAKMSSTIVLRRTYTLAEVPDAPVKLDSIAITRGKDTKTEDLKPHLRNTGTRGVIKLQIGYGITALDPTTLPNPPSGVVNKYDLLRMDVIGPVEEFDRTFLPFEEVAIQSHPLDDSVFVEKYGDIPRTITFFVASVTFLDGTTWTADPKKLSNRPAISLSGGYGTEVLFELKRSQVGEPLVPLKSAEDKQY